MRNTVLILPKTIVWGCLFITAFYTTTTPATAEEPLNLKYRSDLSANINRQVNDRLDNWLSYYKDLHAHPELSLQERETSRKMAERLTSLGYKVTANIGGYGVVGILSNGDGPMVLIRGDMDALPVVEETDLPYASKVVTTGTSGQPVGIMHACGHDVHQTCLLGTAEVLAHLRDRWRGSVMIVAQPAEEIGRGALMMIEDNLFERFPKPDYCLALHVSPIPTGIVAYTPGWALANVDSVDITIYGRGGHGSRPNEAVDPVMTAAQTIVALQTIVSRRVDPLESAVITVGSIHAGSKHNIIPDEAKLQLTVRSYTDETRKILLDGIRDVTIHTARSMGCERDPDVVVRDAEHTPSTYNDPALSQAAAKVFQQVLGSENVLEVPPVMGGEDFGRFPSYLKVPGFIYWLGSVKKEVYEASLKPDGLPLPSLHSSKYAPDPEPTIKTGVKCMASLALSLLESK